ncbi:MAG: CHAT domain-containing protein, partial [Acidobacteriota bacterium]
TWPQLLEHLKKENDYNVLVYLGHGELAEPPGGGPPIGQLYMESPDGGGHQAIGAPQLAKLLTKFPIPLVLLAGCVTAADPPGMARRRGAEQGVAQALVNSSETGVQMAVGMRMEVLGTAAMTFLNEFFTSLLKTAPGDLDRAVSEGRSQLYLETGMYPPTWAAPVVFRAIDRVPGFEFLNQPVTFQVSGAMAKWLDLRTRLWNGLPDALAHADQVPLIRAMGALDATDAELRIDGVKHGPLLLPVLLQMVSGQTATLAIELVGALAIAELRGRLDVQTAGLEVTSLSIPAAVAAAGFQLLTNVTDARQFELQSVNGQPKNLPAGELLHAEIAASGAAAAHVVTVELRLIEPRRPLWPGNNVVVVTA